MLSSIRINYLSRSSVAHKLNSTFKVVSLIILLICTFFINSYEDIIMLSSYLLLSIANTSINIKIYLKELLYYKILFILILLIDIIALNSIEIITCDLFRIVYLILIVLLFTSITTTNEIVYGIEKITDPLHIKKDSNIILYISLLFKFPNVFNYELRNLIRIYIERKAIISIKIYKNIISKAFNNTLKKLDNMFIDMKMALYGYGKTRTNYRLNKFGIKECLILLLEIVILIIVILR